MAFVMLIILNLAVMASLYLVLFILSAVFGIHFDNRSMVGLFVLAAVFGFGGSFISLLLSKWMAKSSMGVEVIETPQNEAEEWLLMTISKLAAKANLKMPEVGIFEGAPNAFATGWNRNNALVAVSTGLLEMMEPKEIEGVLAHEISHIKHGDMVTMTLMQGVLNTFVFFISRLLAQVVLSLNDDEDDMEDTFTYMILSFVFEMIFSLFATIILMWFSRYREFKADEGAVRLDGKEGIYYALAKLGQVPQKELALNNNMKAFGIVGFIFASHPPIEARLRRIEQL